MLSSIPFLGEATRILKTPVLKRSSPFWNLHYPLWLPTAVKTMKAYLNAFGDIFCGNIMIAMWAR